MYPGRHVCKQYSRYLTPPFYPNFRNDGDASEADNLMLWAARSSQSVSWDVEVLRKSRARNTRIRSPPAHLPTDSRIRPFRSILDDLAGFDAPLQQRLEHRGR